LSIVAIPYTEMQIALVLIHLSLMKGALVIHKPELG